MFTFGIAMAIPIMVMPAVAADPQDVPVQVEKIAQRMNAETRIHLALTSCTP